MGSRGDWFKRVLKWRDFECWMPNAEASAQSDFDANVFIGQRDG
jgi:hypothetical protein